MLHSWALFIGILIPLGCAAAGIILATAYRSRTAHDIEKALILLQEISESEPLSTLDLMATTVSGRVVHVEITPPIDIPAPTPYTSH
jgi:hypothetical protein